MILWGDLLGPKSLEDLGNQAHHFLHSFHSTFHLALPLLYGQETFISFGHYRTDRPHAWPRRGCRRCASHSSPPSPGPPIICDGSVSMKSTFVMFLVTSMH